MDGSGSSVWVINPADRRHGDRGGHRRGWTSLKMDLGWGGQAQGRTWEGAYGLRDGVKRGWIHLMTDFGGSRQVHIEK